MSTTRRGFLKMLGVGAVALTVAPKLLKASPTVPLNSNRRGMSRLTDEEVKQLWANLWNERVQNYSLICSPEMRRVLMEASGK